MEKVLGLDLGTNSIGWAIVERYYDDYILLDRGVSIFQEGVAREKNVEKPSVERRTMARASRRHYFRRRLRKIELLKVLTKCGLCPDLSAHQLEQWKTRKIYPKDEEFILWQRTDDNAGKNPYHDRYMALTGRLDLSKQAGRYMLGRALYHLSQRRGFLSNRKDLEKDDDKGEVKGKIEDLTAEMEADGCKYLGEYFYLLYRRGERIRARYTSRNIHYRAEFDEICRMQGLPKGTVKELERAIFFQRPLKSQKSSVGRCTFERSKSRCPVSHPRFEEFRMLSFINNIKVKTISDEDYRRLNEAEIEAISPLFFRKSRLQFDFEDIAKKLAGRRGSYSYKDDNPGAQYKFNFRMSTSVSGCPVMAGLAGVFGDGWLEEMCSLYTLSAGKTKDEILNDVWHALFFFDDAEKLRDWAKGKLQLDDNQADDFIKIKIVREYASLSLNAINKILSFLRLGYRYDQAVFVANLKAVLPEDLLNDDAIKNKIENGIAEIVSEYPAAARTKEQRVTEYLLQYPGVDERRVYRLYHPSKTDIYRPAERDSHDVLKLGSPRTPSVRNPMAMRALFRLRILINNLLVEGKIDGRTIINIEFSRGLNDANKRRAIELYRDERERLRKKYALEIQELYKAETGMDIEPTENDILKYQLWEEQNHKCLYTGREIRIVDFIGANPVFDIEHTVPRSRGGDDSQGNKTLCECRFNREIKRDKLPSELANHAEITARIDSLGWKERINGFHKQIERTKGFFATKNVKDDNICRRHLLKMKCRYLEDKCERFTVKEVSAGFTNRQGVDIGIIGKYARLYLKTVFEKIYTVKGDTTAEFRRMWGLQEEYEKKERVNHVHHCIDAITIACIGPREYDEWARYNRNAEQYELDGRCKPKFEKPWPTFTEDVRGVADELLVSHYTPDNLPKQSRKKLRVHGKVQLKNGKPVYVQGDTARSSLHQDTFYGAIERDGKIRYVVRKLLGKLQQGDIDKIVDEQVRLKVKDAIERYGFKEAMSGTIWMNEDKGIPIRKVRIYAESVKSPIHLKKQRDLSIHKYKQDYHVANDGNYCMAIYEGADEKGKTKRSFKIVNNLEAAGYYKRSADKQAAAPVVPLSDENDYPLKYILKTGTMVLFYENSPEELRKCTRKELARRLYKVTVMSTQVVENKYHYGRLELRYHQEARAAVDLKAKNGIWKDGECLRPLITIYHTQFNACVEGYDFELTVTGEIKFKNWRQC